MIRTALAKPCFEPVSIVLSTEVDYCNISHPAKATLIENQYCPTDLHAKLKTLSFNSIMQCLAQQERDVDTFDRGFSTGSSHIFNLIV